MSSQPSGFQPCYRHPEEMTGIRCQRCGKPICASCMNPASVGFQCPGCARGLSAIPGGRTGRGRSTRPREPRTRVGARIDTTGMKATYGLIAVIAVITLLDIPTRLGSQWLSFAPIDVFAGQLWRPFTYVLLSTGLIGLVLNSLVLWIIGRALEPVLGGWRFLAVYFAAGLGGALMLTLFGISNASFGGASLAVLGLIGANAAMKLKTGDDIKPDLVLLAILVAANLVLSFATRYWLGQIGGLAAAVAATLLLVFAPRQNRTLLQIVGLLAIGVVCLVGMVVAV